MILGELSIAYRDDRANEATVAVYARQLEDMDFDDLRYAANVHMQSKTFFPSIAELRSVAADKAIGYLPAAEEAWGEVKEAIRKVGYWGTPKWSSPPVAAAVNAIGWDTICSGLVEDAGVNRAHFLRVYEVCRKRRMEDFQVPTLASERSKLLARACFKKVDAIEARGTAAVTGLTQECRT